MAQSSRPWQGTVLGDAGPYSADDWQRTWRAWFGLSADSNHSNRGVLWSVSSAINRNLEVTDNAGLTVTVQAGFAIVNGVICENNGNQNLTHDSNASGNDRIDLIVFQIFNLTQEASLVIMKGTPAATPVAPTPSQSNGTIWQVPLAEVYVANGAVTISKTDITNLYNIGNVAWGVIDTFRNVTGSVIEAHRLLTYDTTTINGVKYATRGDTPIGVSLHEIPSGINEYGEVLREGLCLIDCNGAIPHGFYLEPSGAGNGKATLTSSDQYVAQARDTISAAGRVLCYVKPGQMHIDADDLETNAVRSGDLTTTSATFATVVSVTHTKLFDSSRLEIYASIPVDIDGGLTDGEWRVYSVTDAAVLGPVMRHETDNKGIANHLSTKVVVKGVSAGAYTIRIEHRRVAGSNNVITKDDAIIGICEVLD